MRENKESERKWERCTVCMYIEREKESEKRKKRMRKERRKSERKKSLKGRERKGEKKLFLSSSSFSQRKMSHSI